MLHSAAATFHRRTTRLSSLSRKSDADEIRRGIQESARAFRRLKIEGGTRPPARWRTHAASVEAAVSAAVNNSQAAPPGTTTHRLSPRRIFDRRRRSTYL